MRQGRAPANFIASIHQEGNHTMKKLAAVFVWPHCRHAPHPMGNMDSSVALPTLKSTRTLSQSASTQTASQVSKLPQCTPSIAQPNSLLKTGSIILSLPVMQTTLPQWLWHFPAAARAIRLSILMALPPTEGQLPPTTNNRGGSACLDSLCQFISGAWRVADYAAVRRVVRLS